MDHVNGVYYNDETKKSIRLVRNNNTCYIAYDRIAFHVNLISVQF